MDKFVDKDPLTMIAIDENIWKQINNQQKVIKKKKWYN